MHELERIADAVQRTLDGGKRGLLVTVVGTRGSTYRRAGARVVIDEEGEASGAISGGCLERDLAEHARVWLDGGPRVVTYDSSRAGDVVFGLGLGCRGEIELLIQPFGPSAPPRFPTLQSGTFATVIASQNPRYAVGDAIEAQRGATGRAEIDGCDVFVEVIAPQRSIVILGKGADVTPVAEIARAIGWRAEVVDDPEADLSGYDGAAVMTHNYLLDETILTSLMKTSIPYIGLLGPRTRGDELLASIGADAQARARVHYPIGLDLGAETPEEIGLSIIAEMQAVFRGRCAGSLSQSDGPIHEAGGAGIGNVTGIVLAAGASTRFGSPKQEERVRGETLLARAVRVAREAGCERVIAVVRPGDSVAGADAVENGDAAAGISTSIRAGVRAAPGVRVLILLCDQPLVTPEHLRSLMAIDAPIVASEYAGTIGVPAVFDVRFAGELAALTGDRGARSVIDAHRDELAAVPFEEAAMDIDTLEDLIRIRRRMAACPL